MRNKKAYEETVNELIELNELSEDDTYDFGFTFSNEEDVVSNSKDIEDVKNRLRIVSNMFLNLLNNLSKDSDKDMIKWPNRKAAIDPMIQKVKELTNIL